MCIRMCMAGAISISIAGQLRRHMGRAPGWRLSHQRAAAVGNAAAAAAAPRLAGATGPISGPKAAFIAAHSACWRADGQQRVKDSAGVGLRACRRSPIQRRHRRRMPANDLCRVVCGGCASGSAQVNCETVVVWVAGCRHEPEGGARQAASPHVVQRPLQHLHPI